MKLNELKELYLGRYDWVNFMENFRKKWDCHSPGNDSNNGLFHSFKLWRKKSQLENNKTSNKETLLLKMIHQIGKFKSYHLNHLGGKKIQSLGVYQLLLWNKNVNMQMHVIKCKQALKVMSKEQKTSFNLLQYDITIITMK